MFKLNIPLEDELKKAFVKAIVVGNNEKYKDLIEYKDTNTSSGNPYNRKDCINRKVEDLLPKEEFDVVQKKRANTPFLHWNAEHIQVYHRQTKTLFLVMSETKYKTGHIRDGSDSLHYLLAYYLLNQRFSTSGYETEFGQMSINVDVVETEKMYPLESERSVELKHMLSLLIGDLEVEMLVVVTYSWNRKDEINEVFAYIPHADVRMEHILKEDWSQWITVDYTSIGEIEEQDEEEEVNFDLKQSIKDQLNDVDSTRLKDDEEKEEEGE